MTDLLDVYRRPTSILAVPGRQPDVRIGVDVGQVVDPSVITVTEALWRSKDVEDEAGPEESWYALRAMESLPIATSYPGVAERIVEVARGVKAQTRQAARIRVYIDATGHRGGVTDMLQRPLRGLATLIPVTFTAGDTYRERKATEAELERRLINRHERTVGKAWMVSRMQSLLQCVPQRFMVPETAETRAFMSEMRAYRISRGTRHDSFNAESSAHDDRVISAALTVLDEPRSEVAGLVHANTPEAEDGGMPAVPVFTPSGDWRGWEI